MQTSGDLKSWDSISCTTPQMSTNPYLTHPHCPHRQVHLMGGGGDNRDGGIISEGGAYLI